jgi:hypothetical protein
MLMNGGNEVDDDTNDQSERVEGVVFSTLLALLDEGPTR